MDGDIAPLPRIIELAHKYNAYIFVDDSHATGFLGKNGLGSADIFNINYGKEIDVVNSTMGKAMGGASGGYTSGRKEIIETLRQKSRPYLFSNSLAPPIVGATQKVFELLKKYPQLKQRLLNNTKQFRQGLKSAGFTILGHDECPIAPVYIKDAKKANMMADDLFKEGIYVIGFSYPVVPKGQARIRVQLSAGHTPEQIDKTVKAFIKIGKKHNLIK